MRFMVLSIIGCLTAEATRLTRHLSTRWRSARPNGRRRSNGTRSRGGPARGRRGFEEVINNITEVFWLTNVAKSEMAYISPAYERIWGGPCEELYREPSPG